MEPNLRGGHPHANTLAEYTDHPWDELRASAERVASAFIRRDLTRWALRMYECSNVLEFRVDADSSLKLLEAHFCRVRLCPLCEWRRSLMWRSRLYAALPEVERAHPKGRWIFLTLTIRNVPVERLGQALNEMSRAWQRLTERAEFRPVLGWLRTTEVTKSSDGTAHPHYHCLLLVKPSYFGEHYVKHSRWAELWQEAMRLDYLPVVDVRAVKPGSGIVEEVAKYSVKPTAFTDGDEWLAETARQLRKRRLIGAGGVLRQVLRELEGLRELETDSSEEGDLVFTWQWRERRYKRRQSRGSASSSEG